jgi:hypothetical protein
MTNLNWKSTLLIAIAAPLGGCIGWGWGTIAVPVPGYAPGYYAQPQPAQGAPPPAPAGQPAPAPVPPPPPVAAAPAPAYANSPWAVPQMAPMMLMMAFHPMGLPFGGTELRPGEFVRWQIGDGTDREMPAFIERARLPDVNGNQSWRVKWGAVTGESITIEGVVSPNGQIVQLRERFFNDLVVREVPLQTAQGVVAMGMQNITPEQIGAVDSGMEAVTTPAGTFNAHHYSFQRGHGSIEWWYSDGVPGGLVKISGHSDQQTQRNIGIVQVTAYGTNAVSEM